MHMQTSTPIVSKSDITVPVGDKSNVIRQQLFRNNVAKSDKMGNTQWDFIKGPHFIDFATSISDPHDSFFDGRKSDHAPTSNHLQLPCSTPARDDSLINCLRNCSISEIQSGSEDTTLKASMVEDADNTFGGIELIPETKPSNHDSANKSTEHRRSTIVHPFSFEMREKEKREHKQARLQYKMANAKMDTHAFRAKPAPKFKVLPKVNIVMPMKVENDIVQPATVVPPLSNNSTDVFETNSSTKDSGQSPSNNDLMQLQPPNQMLQAAQTVMAPQAKLPNVKTNAQAKSPQPCKKKPIRTAQAKRPTTIPRSPKLLTAERANTWKQIVEQKLQKEKEELEIKKKKLRLKEHLEKKEIAEMRKKTVHKALPVPRSVIKRPMADPSNPLLIKRRRKN